MITLVDAVSLPSVPEMDSQSLKAATENFGHFLCEAQDARPGHDGQTSQAVHTVDSVLQTLAAILHPLTFSLSTETPGPGPAEPAATALPGVDATPLDGQHGLAPLLRLETSAGEEQAVQEETPPAAVLTSLAAALAAQGVLQEIRPAIPQQPAPSSTSAETHGQPGALASLPTASLRQERHPDSRLTTQAESTSLALPDTDGTLPAAPMESSLAYLQELSPVPGPTGSSAERPLAQPAISREALPGGQQPLTTPDMAPQLSQQPGDEAVALSRMSQPISASMPLHPTDVQELSLTPPLPPQGQPPLRPDLPGFSPAPSEALLGEWQSALLHPQNRRETTAAPPPPVTEGIAEAHLLPGLHPVPIPTAPGQQDITATASTAGLESLTVPPPWHHIPSTSNTLLLHIEPPEFGPLLVHVRLHDRRLTATFQAESSDVEAILRAHLPALHASLSQQGFDVQPIEISLAPDGFGTAGSYGSNSFAQQQSTFHAFTQEPPGSDPQQRHGEPEPGRHFSEPRPYHRRLIDVVI